MPQSSNKTAFLRKKPPFLRVCKKSGKKTETPTAPMKRPFRPKNGKELRHDIRCKGTRPIPRDYEQGAAAQGLPYQQADGALSAAVQSNPPCLHREENPLLRHQETRCHRLYDQPGGQPQPVHRTHQLV